MDDELSKTNTMCQGDWLVTLLAGIAISHRGVFGHRDKNLGAPRLVIAVM
jgi:hypothetical protein